MQKYLKTKDVAKMFNVTHQSVYEWRQAGMPHIGTGKLIFYIEEEIVEWIRNRNSATKVVEKTAKAADVKELVKKIYPK